MWVEVLIEVWEVGCGWPIRCFGFFFGVEVVEVVEELVEVVCCW